MLPRKIFENLHAVQGRAQKFEKGWAAISCFPFHPFH